MVNVKGCTFKMVLSISALFAKALSYFLGLVLLLASMSNLRHSDFWSMSSTGYINFIAKVFLRFVGILSACKLLDIFSFG